MLAVELRSWMDNTSTSWNGSCDEAREEDFHTLSPGASGFVIVCSRHCIDCQSVGTYRDIYLRIGS